MKHSILPLIFLASFVGSGLAADAKPKAKKAPHPAMAQIEDVAGLPRILLIGDSISIGYTLAVRGNLKGRANVHRIPTNGGPTTNGLANLQTWLGDKKWDVIHFNWGLHDLKYIANAEPKPDPKADAAPISGLAETKLADPKGAESHQQVPEAEYEKNLTELVKQLKATGAKLIWCSTTPVPEDSAGRVAGDAAKYNAVAARVMSGAGVPTDDLYTHAKAKLSEVQQPKNVHYTPEGYKYLAEKVTAEIEAALK